MTILRFSLSPAISSENKNREMQQQLKRKYAESMEFNFQLWRNAKLTAQTVMLRTAISAEIPNCMTGRKDKLETFLGISRNFW